MKFLWVRTAVAWIKRAVAHKGSAKGKPPRKRPRVSGARKRIYNAFRKKAQQVLQLYERGKIWFTSSTWGGRWFAAILLVVVLGWVAPYLYPIPDDADTFRYVQLYAAAVAGLGSLYIAGTSFWAKRGSAFFVEYETEKDMNTAEFIAESSVSEEIIGNPANSTMPYVKRLYIRNEKNKYEAIKRILLRLPNKYTLILKEYEKADALLVKPYEDKKLELNAATAYGKRCNLSLLGREIGYRLDKPIYVIKSKEILEKGEIIIETAIGQSYIKNNKKPLAPYDKKKVLIPLISTFRTNDFNRISLDIGILQVAEVAMKENFIKNEIFYTELIEMFHSQRSSASKFNRREGTIKIQITLNTDKEASLCYSFQANKKNYTSFVQENLKKEFAKAYNKEYNKNSYQNLNCEDFVNRFIIFCVHWAKEKWDTGEDRIFDSFTGMNNPLAVSNMKIKTIDDEDP